MRAAGPAGGSVEGVARAAVGKNEGARVADLQVREHSVVLTFEIGVTVHESVTTENRHARTTARARTPHLPSLC